MTQHDDIRELLLDRDDDGPLAPEVQAHLDECEDCRAFADALLGVDARLAALPPVEASAALLARTMERIEREEVTAPAPGFVSILVGLGAALLGGLWTFAKLLALPFTSRRARRWTLGGLGIAVPAVAAGLLVVTTGRELAPALHAPSSTASLELDELEATERQVAFQTTEETDVERAAEGEDGAGWAAGGDRGDALGAQADALALDGDDEDARDRTIVAAGLGPVTERGEASGEAAMAQTVVVDGTRGPVAERNLESGAHRVTVRERGYADEGLVVDTPADRRAQLALSVTTPPAVETPPPAAGEGRFRLDTAQRGLRDEDRGGQDGAAARFLAERERAEGLAFVPASGHWATTYVPGDPAVRALRSRLHGTPALALAERADQGDLALDPPSSGALALSVSADRAAVAGRSRVLLSVGLRGAAVRAGRRPTLEAQVVIDARAGLDAEAQARVRALLTALSRRRQGSDRVGVIVAGPHGGELLPLGSLRFGELTVALRRLAGESDAPPMSLEEAVRAAVASVGQLDDASSPLGSALVLVVSPSLDEADARAIEPAVHAGALAGVTTTALATSDAASLAALDRVAIAGQGRRRVLGSIDGADALVQSEVEAVSRVVARAVRLRVRLAPGVSLVDVIGSRRLDALETQRVREAERAVDRELARRLGITSDRDDDEDGVQIVVPAFYAGDQHAVLLDLVVPGPGPVADVSLRWKDLVRVGNGSASERLTLASGSRPRGPRERQVLGQLVAHELATALREAAASLDRGDAEGARARLDAARALTDGMRAHVRSDRTGEDLGLVAAYQAALGAPTPSLADSLRYASRRRLHGEPLSIDGR